MINKKLTRVYKYLSDHNILPRHSLRPRNVAPVCAAKLGLPAPVNLSERMDVIFKFYDEVVSKSILYMVASEPSKLPITYKQASQGECFVYFIEQNETGFVKIGISNDVSNRIKGLQSSSHLPLTCFKFCVFDSRRLAKKEETRLHRKYAGFRMEGEWFRPIVKDYEMELTSNKT